MLTDLWALDRYSETQHLNYLGQNPPKDHFRKVKTQWTDLGI